MTTMRPIRAIATALLIASLALAACSRSQPDQPAPAAGQPAATTAPAPKAPTPTSGPTDTQPVVLPDGRHPVLIKTVDPDRPAITVDVIQFYQGEDATRWSTPRERCRYAGRPIRCLPAHAFMKSNGLSFHHPALVPEPAAGGGSVGDRGADVV